MSTEFAARMAEHATQADARAATIRADLAKMGGWLATAAAEVTVERLTKYAADVAAAGRSLAAAETLAADCRQAATLADQSAALGRWDIAQLRRLNGKRVRIHYQSGGRLEGVLTELVFDESGLNLMAVVLDHATSIDPVDIAAIELAADHPDPTGPARTGQDDTGPDRPETDRMVADTGYPTAPANGPEATQ